MDPDQTEQSDVGPHCLLVCKNRFEKFARIFSRRHKQTAFSDAVFLGALRVNRQKEAQDFDLLTPFLSPRFQNKNDTVLHCYST